MMTRRHFVGALTAVTTACGLGLGSVFVSRRRLTMSEIVPDIVRPLQGAKVSLRGPDGQTLRGRIEDVSAVRHPARPGAPGTEQISLLLATDNREAPAGIYRLETDDLNLGDLNLSPVGQAGRDRRLEAVITRIV